MLVALLISALLAPAWAADAAPDASSAGGCPGLDADFAPSSGDPNRLRVRFTVHRFGRNRPVYLHYITPSRHLKLRVRLGTARGRCGFLRTGYRRLFPFTAGRGTWRLDALSPSRIPTHVIQAFDFPISTGGAMHGQDRIERQCVFDYPR